MRDSLGTILKEAFENGRGPIDAMRGRSFEYFLDQEGVVLPCIVLSHAVDGTFVPEGGGFWVRSENVIGDSIVVRRETWRGGSGFSINSALPPFAIHLRRGGFAKGPRHPARHPDRVLRFAKIRLSGFS